ncbi:MAG: isochorismatase family protein [Mycobacterium sp.]|nr:isochorismatase family protein [Mycobacterium sp.]
MVDPMPAVAPYNREGLPDPARAALLVIDMQEHFADIATAIVPAVSSLVAAARDAVVPVFYTRHGHQDLAVDGGVLAAWWDGDLSMVGDADWQFLSGITPEPNEPIIDKTRYSAFFGTQLASLLSARDVSDLVICGVVTNCCCETTARDAFMRDYNVFVAANATAATNEDLHISSLKGMAYTCARVLTAAQLCDALARRSPGAGDCGM